MKIQSTVLAMGVAFVGFGACTSTDPAPINAGGSNPGGSGGSSGSGGTTGGAGGAGATGGAGGSSGAGGSGAGPTCSSVTACGGDVVGTWTASASCLSVSGDLDVSNLGIGCTKATITASLKVAGSWTAKSNKNFTDETTTTGDATLNFPAACLMISGTSTDCEHLAAGVATIGLNATCSTASGGGCDCKVTLNQMGGAGVPAYEPAKSGNYTTADKVLTVADTKYDYCVDSNKMTWTPKGWLAAITGTIEFQKSGGGNPDAGGGGAGGAGGSSGPDASAGSGGSGGTKDAGGGSGGSGGTEGGVVVPGGAGPCDIYEAASTPCVAAFSMVRQLSSKYAGPLYQVRKGGTKTGTGGTTQDIGAVGGFGDSAAQDAFCGADACTVSKLYDQSGKGNHLTVAPKGCYTGTASEDDYESNAKARSVTVGGHKVYALYTVAHEGYRNNKTTGMPTGSTDEGIYEIADGKRIGAACCWDFGNAGTDNCNGSIMNTLFFGTGYWGKGVAPGPWFLGDFEGGVWAGGSGASTATNPMNPSMSMEFAFGILKTSAPKNYAIRTANAVSGDLTTAYDGVGPKTWNNKGAIILGIGGDNSNSSLGTFFEGAITTGRPSDATDAAVLKNVQSVMYGK